jgi:hypothetical protein
VALKQPKNSAAAAATDIKRATSISTIANGAVNLRNAIFRIFVVFMPPPGNAIIPLPNVHADTRQKSASCVKTFLAPWLGVLLPFNI